MRINTNDVNFNSKIKLITPKTFNSLIAESNGYIEEVAYPWTIETLKTGKNLFTTKIMDCIAICLTNGKKSLLAHLGIRNREEAEKDSVNEFDINNIEKNLTQKVDFNDKNLHGIIFGGMQFYDNPSSGNTKQLNQIKNLFEKYKTPYSIIGARKDIHFFGKYSLLFNQDLDTLFITNTHFDSNGILGEHEHKEMELDKNNNVKYVVYDQVKSKFGWIDYIPRRVSTSIEEYFKSQFYQVQLNKKDSFE